ncbi:MAG: apolipoprotein N-acyltransferase [Flavobacteriales bacterium]|nr:apolipoprotein N-acyltransferase [Flavobacteriales bacterium]
MQRLPLIVYATLGALLLALAWPFIGSLWPFIFIAWVPMLLLEDHIYRKAYRPRKVFFLAYWHFLLFNLLTTWWIYFASGGGMVMAVMVNALLMTFPFFFFHLTKRRLGIREGLLSFFVYWLAFEYLHYYWELSWPWLSMGNVFSLQPYLVQWYEYSGVSGGSLWVLLVNMIVFVIVRDAFWLSKRPLKQQQFRLFSLTVVIAIPVLISLKMYFSYTETENPVQVVIAQPNIDPYRDKFGGKTMNEQLDIFFALADQYVNEKTDYLVGPETQLSYSVMENKIESNPAIVRMREYVAEFPRLKIVSGMSSHRFYFEGESLSPTAKPTGEPGVYYDHYNASFQVLKDEPLQIYHKMKLVLGVEKVPFTQWFPFLEKWALQMGGSSGSMGSEKEPMVFHSDVDPRHVVVPAICYESIYGEHIASFVAKGADLIFIITNDGWWENTPGYLQHMSYARLRAIENRRSIARCANTGISCFINQRGDVLQQTSWWEPAVISASINANTEQTWFTRMGDVYGRSSMFVAMMLLLLTIARWLQGKNAMKKEV